MKVAPTISENFENVENVLSVTTLLLWRSMSKIAICRSKLMFTILYERVRRLDVYRSSHIAGGTDKRVVRMQTRPRTSMDVFVANIRPT